MSQNDKQSQRNMSSVLTNCHSIRFPNRCRLGPRFAKRFPLTFLLNNYIYIIIIIYIYILYICNIYYIYIYYDIFTFLQPYSLQTLPLLQHHSWSPALSHWPCRMCASCGTAVDTPDLTAANWIRHRLPHIVAIFPLVKCWHCKSDTWFVELRLEACRESLC